MHDVAVVGAGAKVLPQLQEAIGRLHFAGDHTSATAGTRGAYGEARASPTSSGAADTAQRRDHACLQYHRREVGAARTGHSHRSSGETLELVGDPLREALPYGFVVDGKDEHSDRR